MPKKHLVLVGAGHAHMTAMAHISDLQTQDTKVTVIGPSSHHYYSGMGPGMLGGTYTPADISFPVEQMVKAQGGTFVKDSLERIDADNRSLRLSSGATISYDVASFNIGSHIPDAHVLKAGEVFSVKPIENLQAGRQRILDLAGKDVVQVGVVGGGPAALEVAGNSWACGQENGGKGCRVRIYAGKHFMARVPAKVQKSCARIMAKRGIEIIEGSYVAEINNGEVTLEDGRSFKDDLLFTAVGVQPNPAFSRSGLETGADGGLLVNKYLQSPQYPEIFGGGDCISFADQPLDKVGVYAVRQNPILLANLTAQLSGHPLTPFDPGGSYLLIFNCGGNQGVFHKNGVTFKGRLAFWIKDYIDRAFMRRFQP
ncbi:MAG: FAD-dependent oxidoreductase [Thermodesulfobacteriota bacterium]